MKSIYDEFIESDVFDPCSVFEEENEDPRGDYHEIGHYCSQDALSCVGFAPFWDCDLSVAGTDAEDCADPAEDSGRLEEVEPRTNDLIISVVDISLILILGTADVILDPIDIQKRLLSRVNNQNKGFKQANDQQPIEDVLLCIDLNDS